MSSLIFFVLIFGGLYFVLLRPQQQRLRRQRELLSSVGVGDRVVTAGGLVGRVVDEADDRLYVEIADGVVVELLRLAVSRRLEEAEPAPDGAEPDQANDAYLDDDDEEPTEALDPGETTTTAEHGDGAPTPAPGQEQH